MRSVARALAILDLLKPDGRTLTDFAEATGLAVPTVHRILRTLEHAGYVVRLENGDFLPGPAIVRLTFSVGPFGPAHAIIRDTLERLREAFDETSALFVREGDRRVCVESVESTRLVRPVYTAGMSGPIYRGAPGKVLVAFGRTEELLSQIPTEKGKYGLVEIDKPRTRKLSDLKKELDEVRESRLAFSHEEETPDLWSVASPVFVGEILMGAMAVAVPISRMTPAREREIAEVVLELATELSSDRLRLSRLAPSSSRWHDIAPTPEPAS